MFIPRAGAAHTTSNTCTMHALQKLRSIEMSERKINGRLNYYNWTRQMGNHYPNSQVYHRRRVVALPRGPRRPLPPPDCPDYPPPPPRHGFALPPPRAFDHYAPTHDDYY
ncbi:hypothetical protein ACET3Z_028383 [Daucus carota]